MNNEFSHILRLGTHAEAEYFRKGLPLYDVVLLNANLVEFTPAASAALIASLGKPYIIDPFTHAFVAPPQYVRSTGKTKSKTKKIKKSFEALAKAYFGGDVEFLGNSALSPDAVVPQLLAKGVLEYQRTRLTNALPDAVDEDIREKILAPAWYIAPYFPIKRNLAWLDVNLECLRAALVIEPAAAAVLPVTCDILEKNPSIVSKYVDTGVKSVFVWIEDFDEDAAEERDLHLYVELVKRFTAQRVMTLNLFGGFFSCIANKHGLSGFAHGLGYGENKGFVPVTGGGQPPPRYYFKPIRVNTSVVDAATILAGVDTTSYFGNVCDCTICQTIFTGDDVSGGFSILTEPDAQSKFSPRTYSLCRYHFLLARHDEVSRLRLLSSSELSTELVRNEEFMDRLDAHGKAKHLESWRQFLA